MRCKKGVFFNNYSNFRCCAYITNVALRYSLTFTPVRRADNMFPPAGSWSVSRLMIGLHKIANNASRSNVNPT